MDPRDRYGIFTIKRGLEEIHLTKITHYITCCNYFNLIPNTIKMHVEDRTRSYHTISIDYNDNVYSFLAIIIYVAKLISIPLSSF